MKAGKEKLNGKNVLVFVFSSSFSSFLPFSSFFPFFFLSLSALSFC